MTGGERRWKGEGKKRKRRGRELPFASSLWTFQQQPGCGQAEAKNMNLGISYLSVLSLSTWVIICCLPGHFSINLDEKLCSQDLNCHSDREGRHPDGDNLLHHITCRSHLVLFPIHLISEVLSPSTFIPPLHIYFFCLLYWNVYYLRLWVQSSLLYFPGLWMASHT